MSRPSVPPGFQPPPPPQPPQQQAPAVEDPKAELHRLIAEKGNYNGAPFEAPENIAWAEQELVTKLADIQGALRFMRSSTTINFAVEGEIKPAFHNYMNEAPVDGPTPPVNNISDSTEPPKDKPDPAPEKEPAASKTTGEEWQICKECGYVSTGKTLRGLKTHVKKSHQMEWEDYCQHHGLALKTGLPLGDVPEKPAAGIDDGRPRTPPPASPGMPTVVNEQGQSQATPPAGPAADGSGAVPPQGGPSTPPVAAASQQTNLFQAPADQPAPAPSSQAAQPPSPAPASDPVWADLPQALMAGQPDQGVDYRAAAVAALPQRVFFRGPTAVTAEQAAQVADHLAHHFQSVGAQGQEYYQLCCWLSWLDQSNAYHQLPFDSNGVVNDQPAPQEESPAQQPPHTGPMVTYDPNAAPPATVPLGPPVQQPIDAASHPDPAVRAAGALFQSAPPEMVQQATQQATQYQQTNGQSPRREHAQMLGGAVDCVFFAAADTATIPDLAQGRADANALARMAEQEGIRQIQDPEGLKYRRDRQVAEREFANLLTQNPKVYVLMNGYDMVLDDNFFRILSARITDGGVFRSGQFLSFKF